MYQILLIIFLNILSHNLSHGSKLKGFRVQKYSSLHKILLSDDMIPRLAKPADVQLILFGDVQYISQIALTANEKDCEYLEQNSILKMTKLSDFHGSINLIVPDLIRESQNYYFCIKETKDQSLWIHQGADPSVTLFIYSPLLTFPLSIVIIIVCVLISGILNGLVVGLMSLGLSELKVLSKSGNESERSNARTILTVRKTGNYLLISLVVGSTCLNSITTVIIDSLVTVWITIIIVTIILVVFCEIIPSSTFARYPLIFGSKTIVLTWAIMFITFPISYPLGKFLNFMLGTDSHTYTRERLKELIRVTADINKEALEKMEVDIVTGALEMSGKKVEMVMTHLADVYSISLDATLNYDTIGEIMSSGFSRIPIFENSYNNITRILHVRNLVLLDPNDNTPVRAVTDALQDECTYVQEGTTLNTVFSIFKEGVRGHMAFVYSLDNESDPPIAHNVVGLLTLEDILEEIIQQEIVDEFDTIVDNRSKRKRDRRKMASDFVSAFADSFDSKSVFLSCNLREATQSFLQSEIHFFNPNIILPPVLRKLLTKGVFFHLPGRFKNTVIFSEEKTKNCFVMLIEGRAEIVVSPEPIRCECGPFTYFGILYLDEQLGSTTKYDYYVKTLTEVRFLKITKDMYETAKATSLRIMRREESITNTMD